MKYSRITGTGSYLPEKVLTNFDLEKIMEEEGLTTVSGIIDLFMQASNE